MSSTTTTSTNQADEGIELTELFGGSAPPQRVNTDTKPPTPVLPPAAHIRSSTSDHHLSSIRKVSVDTRKSAVIPDEKKTWFGYVMEYAPIEPLALLLDVAVKWAI
jgi:hypothetical protein